MNDITILITILLSITSCYQKGFKDKTQASTTFPSNSSTTTNKDSDTTIYDYLSMRIIKMNSVDSTEAIEDKIFYENDTNEITVFELTNLKEIESIKKLLAQRITLIYKQAINGFKVKVFTGFYNDNSETSKSILEFSNSKGDKKWFLVYDFFDDSLNDFLYNQKVKPLHRDTTIYVDYQQIEKAKFLGYNTPFYFQDVNLDGDLELVFNGYYQYSRENHSLFVYSLTKNKFLTDSPFNRLSSQAEYDFRNNTITWYSSSGATFFGHYVYGFYRPKDDNSKFIFYLKELNVSSGNIYSTYQYDKKGTVINVIRRRNTL